MNKKICWPSPSEYIFATQFENISFFTYAKLMNMDETEVSQIKPD